jgi:hypothetical protein
MSVATSIPEIPQSSIRRQRESFFLKKAVGIIHDHRGHPPSEPCNRSEQRKKERLIILGP